MTFDCVVVGSGPGGYVAAVRAAQLGMKTAVIEKDAIGGRCLNYACIPAKTVLRSADMLAEVRRADEFGIKVGEPTLDYSVVQARRLETIATLAGGVRHLLDKNRIELIQGTAKVADAHTLVVDDQTISAQTALILATGSTKKAPPGITFGGRIVGTEEAWAFGELPDRLAVVGAGPSGAEIASAFARLGTRVQLFEATEHVLPTEDPDISKVVAGAFRQQGIDVRTKTVVGNVISGEDEVTFDFGDESGSADWLVVAVGRSPDVAGLGLDAVGIDIDPHGLVSVGPSMRTSVDGIWAIGDLVSGPALAHKASAEAIIAVEDAAGLAPEPLASDFIPRVTFCSPNVASFGLTEEQARQAGHDVTIGRVPFSAVGATTVNGLGSGLIKVIGDKRHGELLGAHLVGPKATDLIQELVSVHALEGGYPEAARIIHSHPTLSEGVQEAARAADQWLIHG